MIIQNYLKAQSSLSNLNNLQTFTLFQKIVYNSLQKAVSPLYKRYPHQTNAHNRQKYSVQTGKWKSGEQNKHRSISIQMPVYMSSLHYSVNIYTITLCVCACVYVRKTPKSSCSSSFFHPTMPSLT